MNYTYGQFIYCKANFKSKFLAMFLVYRPEKNTVVVDYENRLHEIKLDQTQEISNEQILAYFNEKIDKYETNIKEYKKCIEEDNAIIEKSHKRIVDVNKEIHQF